MGCGKQWGALLEGKLGLGQPREPNVGTDLKTKDRKSLQECRMRTSKEVTSATAKANVWMQIAQSF